MAACGCGGKKEDIKNKTLVFSFTIQEPKAISNIMELVISEKYQEAWTQISANESNLNLPLDNVNEGNLQSGMTILMLAVLQQAQPLIDLILVNARNKAAICQQKDIHGDTALHLAALTGSRETIEKLLNYGFNKEARNNVRNGLNVA